MLDVSNSFGYLGSPCCFSMALMKSLFDGPSTSFSDVGDVKTTSMRFISAGRNKACKHLLGRFDWLIHGPLSTLKRTPPPHPSINVAYHIYSVKYIVHRVFVLFHVWLCKWMQLVVKHIRWCVTAAPRSISSTIHAVYILYMLSVLCSMSVWCRIKRAPLSRMMGGGGILCISITVGHLHVWGIGLIVLALDWEYNVRAWLISQADIHRQSVLGLYIAPYANEPADTRICHLSQCRRLMSNSLPLAVATLRCCRWHSPSDK